MIPTNFLTVRYQTGATLFVGLLLLLAISIVSLAAMRTSILDLIIANNKQQYTFTFEAAEQVINQRLTNMNLSIDGTEVADTQLAPTQQAIAVQYKDSSDNNVKVADVDSVVTYRGSGAALGWSLNGTAYHFQLDSEATAPGRGANANHRIGFYIVAPN